MYRFLLTITSIVFTILSSGYARADELPAVRVLLSNTAPFVGEEVIVTLEVRTSPRPQGAIIPVWPNLDSSASADLPTPPPRLEEEQAVLVQIMQRAIRPLHSGRLPLLSAGVSIAGHIYHAQPVELRVQPLPKDGRDDEFAGAIGQVTMHLEEEGQGSREIHLLLKGNTSLENFPTPQAELGSGERLILLDDSTVGMAPQERTRTLRYLYLPGGNDRGRLVFRLPVFDPIAREYVIHKVGIRHLPTWLIHGFYFLLALLLCYLTVSYYRKSRTPRTVDEALERIVGRPPHQLCREEIIEILQRQRADDRLLDGLAAHWKAHDALRYAPSTMKNQGLSADDLQRSSELLLNLIRMKSWLRWLLTSVEKTIKDQMRARMAKLSM